MSREKKQKKETRNSAKVIQDISFFQRLSSFIKKYDYIFIFILCLLAYNTTSFNDIISGDVIPASFLPFSLIVYHNPNFDYMSDIVSQPELNYAFPVVQGHTVSLFLLCRKPQSKQIV
ncbi:hypothetical protein [uncultured Methanoregula sp.]|uniref:hypothetical protein n=1 Tax=uncultured Methanoregula sp. TaxID=1005933 RepID=UPI002AABCE05|nr:hypothetical protein [uncultured Methanoregula sp.]